MAWGVPKLGTTVTSTSGNFDLVEPVGVASGDLMVACIAMRSTAVVTPPAGWVAAATQQNSGNTDTTDGIASGAMFYIVRGGSAPSLTFTRTAGDVAFGKIISYSGPASSPLDAGVAGTQGVAGNTPSAGSITTAEDGELIVAMVAGGDSYTVSAFDAGTNPTTASGATDTTTAPTAGTWIERYDASTTSGADTMLGVADAIRSAAGGTGLIQATMSSASGRNVMMAAAFKLNRAFTQAAFRVYDDGTETGSSALASQDTNYTADLSSGDVNLQLRTRLQETSANTGMSTDDYQLQYSKNGGTYSDVGVGAIMDSYDFSNSSGSTIFGAGSSITKVGQSFTGDGNPINSATLYLINFNVATTGTITLEIYAHSGSYGTSSIPTGAALATSTTVNVAEMTTTSEPFNFFFNTPYTSVNGTNYVLVADGTALSAGSATVRVSIDALSPTHSGNLSSFNIGTGLWSASASNDLIFLVNSLPPISGYNSGSLTDGNATTNRLGSGSGSFVAGKISEEGLVDNLQITASNYTELLYSLTIDSDAVADADTLDFHVLRNGATTDMTYTVTPRITISESAGGDLSVSKSESVTVSEAVQREVESYINKSDSVGVAESVKVELNSDRPVSDSTSVSEALKLELESSRSVSDTATVSESVTLLIPELYRAVSDSATVSEALSVEAGGVPTYNVTVSDSVGVAESRKLEVESYINKSEAISVAEQLALLVPELYKAVSDSITVAESVSVSIEAAVATYSINVSDNISVSETVRPDLTVGISVDPSNPAYRIASVKIV